MNINDLRFVDHGRVWEKADKYGHIIYRTTIHNKTLGPNKFQILNRIHKVVHKGYSYIGVLEAQCILNLISEGKEIPND